MNTDSSPTPEIEIYPMASFPTLVVRDIQASIQWYCDALGFTNVFTMPGPDNLPMMMHLRWIKYADLLLFPERTPHTDPKGLAQPKGLGVALNYSTADVEALAARAREHGANIVEDPVNRPWNICEMSILDPDGYRLVFNGPVTSGEFRGFEEIVESAAKGFRE